MVLIIFHTDVIVALISSSRKSKIAKPEGYNYMSSEEKSAKDGSEPCVAWTMNVAAT